MIVPVPPLFLDADSEVICSNGRSQQLLCAAIM